MFCAFTAKRDVFDEPLLLASDAVTVSFVVNVILMRT
jgi:hypothetical protein